MAVQILTSSACSSWLGGLADSIEARGMRNGRLQIMASGLLLSTVATLLHVLGRFWMPLRRVSSTITEDDNYTENDIESQQVVSIPLLTYHLLLRALYAIGTTACSPVLDGLTLARLENDGRDTAEYGKERLYGAVSWGIANVFFGPAIDKFGFTIIYVTTTISFIGCITTFYFYAKSNQMQYYEGIDENDLECISENEEAAYKKATAKYKSKTSFEQSENEENEEYEDSQQQHQLQHQKLSIPILLSALTKKNALLNVSYIIAIFSLYIGMSVVENLIFLYFEFLGGSYSMCGITVAVTVLFELPLFHYAPEVLRQLKSPVWLFQFGCIAYVIRVVGYSLIPLHHPYWTLILEPLHGVTIGFVTVGCVAFAAVFPKGYEASGQGFLSMIRGLGQFVGLCIGGFLEGRILYRILAAIVTVGSVILAIGNHITIIETPTPNAEEEEDRISSTSEKKEQSNKHGLELVPLDDESTILT